MESIKFCYTFTKTDYNSLPSLKYTEAITSLFFHSLSPTLMNSKGLYSNLGPDRVAHKCENSIILRNLSIRIIASNLYSEAAL